METFYLIVLGIAIVVLILILTFVGLLMQTGKKNVVYPPIANTCPDGWTVDSDGSCNIPTTGSSNMNGKLQSDLETSLSLVTATSNKFDPNHAGWTSSGKTAICAQKKWANKNNILWDGVSNYNSCK